jgi:hypothetical protein
MVAEFPFKRLLLKLPYRLADRSVIDVATAFAERFKLSLAAELIEEAELEWLAEIPGLRELHALGKGWYPIDRARWHEELGYAERRLRGIFEASIRNRALNVSFSATRTTMPFAFSDIGAEDIVAIPQPRNPIDIITQQLDDLSRAAFGTPAAVMLVSPSSRHGMGPIVVIAGHPRDPSIRVGIEVAAASRQELILVPTHSIRGDIASSQAIAIDAGVSTRIGEPIESGLDMASVLVRVARYKAELVITTRSAGKSVFLRPSETVGKLRTTVLLVDAAET